MLRKNKLYLLLVALCSSSFMTFYILNISHWKRQLFNYAGEPLFLTNYTYPSVDSNNPRGLRAHTNFNMLVSSDKLPNKKCPTFLIIHPETCSNGTRHIFMVFTKIRNILIRRAIRDTWGKFVEEKYNSKILFLIGQPIMKPVQDLIEMEDSIHNDILQSNFIDSYKNLTLKSVAMVKWLSMYCPNVSYVIKIDDDVMLNVQELFSQVLYTNHTNSILGYIGRHWRPNRDHRSKWYLDRKYYAKRFLPHFATGPMYIMTGDITKRLYKASLTVPFIPLEDVFMTGVVAGTVHVNLITVSTIFNNRTLLHPCLETINSHGHSYKELRIIWNKFVNMRFTCLF